MQDPGNRYIRRMASRGGIFFACAMLCHLSTCMALDASSQATENMSYHLQQLKKEIKPLNLSRLSETAPHISAYLKYYNLIFKDVNHFMGTFNSGAYVVTAQVFIPPNPKATVFILHGYLDHAGIQRNIIEFCLDQGFAAAVYDLPGHGLSGGKSCSISDFSDYVSVFDDFIKTCRSHLPRPYYVIGHSMGCAIVFDYLHSHSDRPFEKIIYGAPLVRSAYWTVSKAHHFFAKTFVESVPRLFIHNSSDPDFIDFLEKDPLQCQRIPLKWVEALHRWNDRIQPYPKISQSVLILQGRADAVVDYEYNIPFLRKKNDQVIVRWFENAGHQLFNEKLTIRLEVLAAARKYLKAP